MSSLNLTGKILVLGVVVLGMAKTAIAQGQAAAVYSARIDSSTGKVFLKRPDWSNFRPVSVGTELNQGDQIKPDKGVRVRVVCPNLSKPFVPVGVQSGLKTICPVWQAIISKAPPPAGTLGGNNPLIPYLIAPRHTLLLSSTPTFRWNAVPKATQYTVILQNPKGVMWQKQVKNNSLVYPGLPALQPGTNYSLVIKANTGKTSQDEGTSNLDFRLLRKSEVAAIQAEVTKITKLGLNKQVTALMLANLYSRYTLPQDAIAAYGLSADTFKSYNLSADAIATLENVVKTGKQSTIVYRSLGDIYWQTGLAQKAVDNYLMAIKLAKSSEDLEAQTLGLFALGEVYAATDDIKQAIKSYSQAKNGYILLGDSRRANFLKQQIESLKQQ
jgi:hypothetical protein